MRLIGIAVGIVLVLVLVAGCTALVWPGWAKPAPLPTPVAGPPGPPPGYTPPAPPLSTPAPTGPDTAIVKPIPSGETRSAGTLVIMRKVNNSAKTIDVTALYLTTAVKFGPASMVSIDGWEGYQTLSHAQGDACREAQARLTDSRTRGSWAEGYAVTLSGGAVPDVCR